MASEFVKGEAPIIAHRAQGQLEKLVSRRWCGCHVPWRRGRTGRCVITPRNAVGDASAETSPATIADDHGRSVFTGVAAEDRQANWSSAEHPRTEQCIARASR